MNDQDLKELWQRQPLKALEKSPERVFAAMQNKTTLLRQCLASRDLRELAACIAVIVIFGIFYFTVYHTPSSRLGCLVVIGSSIFIAGRLIGTRWSTPPAAPGATIVEAIRADLKAVRAQAELLRTVFWWYLLPLAAGIFLCTWGSYAGGARGLLFNTFYSLGVMALFAWIYRLNQRARAHQLLPVINQLESLLHSAETGEPLDETQGFHLAPVVVASTEAAHAKPAEFKVAFWQIALFGEIGFVGIWFFLMLGWPISQKSDRSGVHHPPALSNPVQSNTNDHYVIVARTVIDRLNAGDYAGVQKLYDPDMSRAFPPTKTLQFYTRLAKRFGNIRTFDGPAGGGYAGWTAFHLYCERGELLMSLALDTENQIAGIYFEPLRDASSDNGPLLSRLLSWQRLVCVGPFFLAGLVYSWMLQKGTRRAVGISMLGIHLQKGMNLILWDEIKEVRVFRLLHLRSLYLIKSSGEKILMPWSSLERPAQLRAAVEMSAPSNHPIRQHLSLLRAR